MEWELVKAAPTIQASVVDTGVSYMDYELDLDGSRIILKFFAMRQIWDRKTISGMTGMMVKTRFPDIKSDIWVFQVIDIFAKRTYQFDNGKWNSEPWDQKKK